MEGSPVISTLGAREPLVLALDLGTSSVRALAFDGLGRVVEGSDARVPLEFRSLPDGRVETGADRVVEAAFTVLDGCLASLGREAGRIRAVASCSLVTNILGLSLIHI